MNRKGRGRKLSLSSLSYHPASGLKVQTVITIKVRIIGVTTEVQTGHLPSTSQGRYPMKQLVLFDLL
jgi:hypothetical protein